MRLRAATMFSGIGAPEVARPDWDWRWCAEIEKFPAAVHDRIHEGPLPVRRCEGHDGRGVTARLLLSSQGGQTIRPTGRKSATAHGPIYSPPIGGVPALGKHNKRDASAVYGRPDMTRRELIDAIADKIAEANGSDLSLAELEREQPDAAKWARELALAALDEIAANDLRIVAIKIIT